MFSSLSPERMHGGQLRAAVQRFHIPLQQWMDLSTGINPIGWPVPQVPAEVWQRLPEEEDGLLMVCMVYAKGTPILPVPGSQAVIQALPQLYGPSRVGIISPCYAEHERAWRTAGHHVTAITEAEADSACDRFDVLVISNPNNPTGRLVPPATLLEWQRRLAARGGLLVVDEAFMDATPKASILSQANRPGLVVLRSLGKFWGLAGIRCGFVLAEPGLLGQIRDFLGPWALNNPARWIAQRALSDRAWQNAARERLVRDSARLVRLLDASGLHSPSGCPLFRWVPTERATELFDAFAQRAVLVRAFPEHKGLRIGLPAKEEDWLRLEAVLEEVGSESGVRGEE